MAVLSIVAINSASFCWWIMSRVPTPSGVHNKHHCAHPAHLLIPVVKLTPRPGGGLRRRSSSAPTFFQPGTLPRSMGQDQGRHRVGWFRAVMQPPTPPDVPCAGISYVWQQHGPCRCHATKACGARTPVTGDASRTVRGVRASECAVRAVSPFKQQGKGWPPMAHHHFGRQARGHLKCEAPDLDLALFRRQLLAGPKVLDLLDHGPVAQNITWQGRAHQRGC